MTPSDAIADFAHYHALDVGALLVEERDAIRCTVDCHNAINDGYAHLPDSILEREPGVGLLWQLYERCTEHIHGALVAMATACPASSEVLARSSLEATVAIRYILGDRNPRLASFFQNHVKQSESQEQKWRKSAEQLLGQEKSIHLGACDYRRQGIEAMKSFVDMINRQMVPTSDVPPWPRSIAELFEKIGEGIKYRTFYARLSTAVHFDAEETLRYFIGVTTSPEIVEKLSVETVMFSRFLLAEAVRAYAETGKEYATAYNMAAAIKACEAAERQMRRHSLSLSRYVGATPP
jgi:hypothetical protein